MRSLEGETSAAAAGRRRGGGSLVLALQRSGEQLAPPLLFFALHSQKASTTCCTLANDCYIWRRSQIFWVAAAVCTRERGGSSRATVPHSASGSCPNNAAATMVCLAATGPRPLVMPAERRVLSPGWSGGAPGWGFWCGGSQRRMGTPSLSRDVTKSGGGLEPKESEGALSQSWLFCGENARWYRQPTR